MIGCNPGFVEENHLFVVVAFFVVQSLRTWGA
jgi:hypothetical protein